MNTITQAFTADELTALTLATSRAFFASGTRTRWTMEDQDGDAWAALEAYGTDEDGRYGWGLVSTIQLTEEPGRRFVALAADGLAEVAAGDDLGAILADLFQPIPVTA
jgi:hypothetical protein